jgi:hypothetical protein
MALVKWMNSTAGRTSRVLAGIVLVGLGAFLQGGWWVLVGVGLVPLGAGLAGACLLGPVLHASLRSDTASGR